MGTQITEKNITNIHKKPFSQIVREVISISDIILEILDSRYINETRIPALEEEIRLAGKKIIYVINKSDMVDTRSLDPDILKNVKPYVFVSSKMRRGKIQLLREIKIEMKKMSIKFQRKHVGVIGYPNTGKSSLINYLSGRRAARTSAEANYTRGMQRIKLTRDLLLLDTPGVVPPTEDNLLHKSIIKKAEMSIESYSQTKDPELAVANLLKKHKEIIEKFYGIEVENYEDLAEKLGRKMNYLIKGGKVDYDKILRKILKDWQEGKIR